MRLAEVFTMSCRWRSELSRWRTYGRSSSVWSWWTAPFSSSGDARGNMARHSVAARADRADGLERTERRKDQAVEATRSPADETTTVVEGWTCPCSAPRPSASGSTLTETVGSIARLRPRPRPRLRRSPRTPRVVDAVTMLRFWVRWLFSHAQRAQAQPGCRRRREEEVGCRRRS